MGRNLGDCAGFRVSVEGIERFDFDGVNAKMTRHSTQQPNNQRLTASVRNLDVWVVTGGWYGFSGRPPNARR